MYNETPAEIKRRKKALGLDTWSRTKRKLARTWKAIKGTAITTAIITVGVTGAAFTSPTVVAYQATDATQPTDEPAERIGRTIEATVTGYNTVPEQTDDTPCIAASGDDICGRTDVIACPRAIALGTAIEIDGKAYTCLDRLNKKFDNRFDISCDKDMACPYAITGTKAVTIYD